MIPFDRQGHMHDGSSQTAAQLGFAHVDQLLVRAKAVRGPFYLELPPAADLADFVACTWVRIVRLAPGQLTDAILPDGCSDLMSCDDFPPLVAGPDAVTKHVTLRDGGVITGIRLRPGAARAVFGIPAHRLVSLSVRLADLAPGAKLLHRRLIMCGTLRARLHALEGWVRTALERASPHDRAVVAACRRLSADSQPAIAEVARELDWNVRMIHRQFLGACGYSPKHFQRIMRIQQVLRAAAGEQRLRLGDFAAAAGYADQAHMTRDFREITGFTPAAYLASLAVPGWGAWLDEVW
jgi:AraC-like DNA-binding protein